MDLICFIREFCRTRIREDFGNASMWKDIQRFHRPLYPPKLSKFFILKNVHWKMIYKKLVLHKVDFMFLVF